MYTKRTFSDKNIVAKIYFWEWKWATFHFMELQILEHKNSILNPDKKITEELLPNHFTHIKTLLAEFSF